MSSDVVKLRDVLERTLRLTQLEFASTITNKSPKNIMARKNIYLTLYKIHIYIARLYVLFKSNANYQNTIKSLKNVTHSPNNRIRTTYRTLLSIYNDKKTGPSNITHDINTKFINTNIESEKDPKKSYLEYLFNFFNDNPLHDLISGNVKGNEISFTQANRYTVQLHVSIEGNAYVDKIGFMFPKPVHIPPNFLKNAIGQIRRSDVSDKHVLHKIHLVLSNVWISSIYYHIIHKFREILPEYNAVLEKGKNCVYIVFPSRHRLINRFPLKLESNRILLTSNSPVPDLPTESYVQTTREKFSNLSSMYFCRELKLMSINIDLDTNLHQIMVYLRDCVNYAFLIGLWTWLTHISISSSLLFKGELHVNADKISSSYLLYSSQKIELCKISLGQKTGKINFETAAPIKATFVNFVMNFPDYIHSIFINSYILKQPILPFGPVASPTIRASTKCSVAYFKPSYSANYSVRVKRKAFRPEFDVVSDSTGETYQSATLFAYHAMAVRRCLTTIPSIFSDATTLALILSIRDGLRNIGFKAVQIATGVIGYFGITLEICFKIHSMRYWQLTLMALEFPGKHSHLDIHGNSLSMRFAERICRIASEAKTMITIGKQLFNLINNFSNEKVTYSFVEQQKVTEIERAEQKVPYLSNCTDAELGRILWTINDRKMSLTLERVTCAVVSNDRKDRADAVIHPFITPPISLRLSGTFLPLSQLLSQSHQNQIGSIIRCYIPPALRLYNTFNTAGWNVIINPTFTCASIIFGRVFTIHAIIRPFPSTLLLIPHKGPTALLRMNLREFNSPAEISRPHSHISHILLNASNTADFKKRCIDAFKLLQLLRLAMPAATIEYTTTSNGEGVVKLVSKHGKMICTVSHISVSLSIPDYPEVGAVFAALEGKQPVQVHLGLLRMMTRYYEAPFFKNLVAILSLVAAEPFRWDVFIKNAKFNESAAAIRIMSAETGSVAQIVVLEDSLMTTDESRSMPLAAIRPQLEYAQQRIDFLAHLFPDSDN